MPDIDIDFKDRDEVLKYIKHIPASRIQDNELRKHNTSIYVQDIPRDPITELSSVEYKKAEEFGYSKIDFLNISIYEDVESEEHLNSLVNQEPNWALLEYPEVVNQLFQIHDHFELIKQLKPRSIDELAMTIAMIRPAKRNLAKKTWAEIEKEVWIKPDNDQYYFKKAHGISYALAIVVQMNLLVEKLTKESINIEDVSESTSSRSSENQ